MTYKIYEYYRDARAADVTGFLGRAIGNRKSDRIEFLAFREGCKTPIEGKYRVAVRKTEPKIRNFFAKLLNPLLSLFGVIISQFFEISFLNKGNQPETAWVNEGSFKKRLCGNCADMAIAAKEMPELFGKIFPEFPSAP